LDSFKINIIPYRDPAQWIIKSSYFVL
jgi:hypothetical protein